MSRGLSWCRKFGNDTRKAIILQYVNLPSPPNSDHTMSTPHAISRMSTRTIRKASQAMHILAFDFLSHGDMHHNFNEGYLRILRSGFPEDNIHFYASKEHVRNLAPHLDDVGDIKAHIVDRHAALERTNPLNGWAEERNARRCVNTMSDALHGKSVRFIAVLGADAGLYAAVRKRWRDAAKPLLHIVLHGQLGLTFHWRTRNPLLRWFDLQAQMSRMLPPNVQLVALEVGIKEAVAAAFPLHQETLSVLEHPILVSEWRDDKCIGHPLRIGFLGSIGPGKGFEDFAKLAMRAQSHDVRFELVGHSTEAAKYRDPNLPFEIPNRSLARQDYLRRLQSLSFVCALMNPNVYDFTGSGTICDAISALKPIIGIRNATLSAIFEAHGPIGRLFDKIEDLESYILRFSMDELEDDYDKWRQNLSNIRNARRPTVLAPAYRDLVLAKIESYHGLSP